MTSHYFSFSHCAIQLQLQDSVEELQSELVGRTDEGAFLRVAEIDTDLLVFRKMLIPVRDALAESAARKSSFISEETRPFLAAMTESVDRVISGMLVDRELLSASLNRHIAMVTHRTNQIMNRLTVVSIISLPLTFLCSIYGMNFEIMPELQWQYGYPTFWVVACVLTAVLSAIMRRNRLLQRHGCLKTTRCVQSACPSASSRWRAPSSCSGTSPPVRTGI